MLYLMAEIWIYLLIAALFGALSAWLVSHGRSLDRVDRTEGSWKTRLRSSEDEWKQKLEAVETRLQRELEERERHTTALTEQLQGERQRSGGLNDKLAEEAANYQGLRDELDSTRAKLRMLDDRLSIALEVGDKAEVALRRATKEFEETRAQLEQAAQAAATERDEARAQLKEARERRIDLEKQLSESRQSLQEAAAAPPGDGGGAAASLLRARIRDLENQVREVETSRSTEAERLSQLEDALGRRERRIRELEPLEDAVAELEDQVELLEQEMEQLRGTSATGAESPDSGPSNGVRSDAAHGLELKIAAAVQDLPDLDALLARAPRTGSLGPGIDNGRTLEPGGTDLDDLRRIRGIGPVLQRKLRQLGYRTFAQIAGWTDEDIERVCETLPIFPDRIRREAWVDQARKLQGANEHA